ncbi:hypothetical protein FPV60_19370 [Acinetobacter colistiniresistens]|uniref:Uncharacterized protein n=1 Tax=Acinetobacter colistiniresistens TaxID=280145 RepID=A0A558EVQ6_9GAMM|nr:hypothetical protein FPV60_19370 [Acinetobacter colistiniresistens]
MFITSFGEQNITYKCCSNFLIHLYFPLNYTEYYEKNDSSCSLSKFLKTFWSRYYKTALLHKPSL